MPEDVGGTPFPDGWEPDDDHDHGVSDEEFASVVLDEAFVRAATVHEPSAVERLLAAARARAEASEAEARRAHARGERLNDGYDPESTGSGQDPDDGELDGTYVLGDHRGLYGPFGKQVRWHRPVAWILAVVMGIGMVALTFAAVYRGGSPGTRDRVPAPASTGRDQGSAAAPSVPAGVVRPTVPAAPHSP
ncbi:hypothetical protein D9753_23765 [Streptomyces dangxiongensis]|uniref:Uncharacterized protein n=1 Tax=Streptomyces dangxiongensis TaxID=1442032 RepID=A0A3G2JP35_9ACTN|nr:hypothetical protein [Streptomyces dangxiongensis]AYN41397.1 hypothetical protein D9753_23765 [Streptomyces dangxiongensis]